jgi:hypothetical protein
MSNAVAKIETQSAPESATLLAVISRAASDPQVDIDKFERLLEIQGKVEAKDAEAEFNRAMRDAQSKMTRISTDATNPQTRSNYATYGKLDRALRPIYTESGFSLSFDTDDSPKPDHVRVLCYVSHVAGHSRTYKADLPVDGKGAKGNDVMTKTHAFGSGTSYAMRYLLKMIFNVAVGEDDDDGNAAGGRSAGPITDEQLSTLRDWIANTASNEEAFCAAMKIGSLEAMPATKFQSALAALKRKADQLAGK